MFVTIIFIVLLLIISLFFYAKYTSTRYINAKPPSITSDNLKSLVATLIQNQEQFVGTINVRYIDSAQNSAEITLMNNYSGDDSIGATEYKMIAEKKGQFWTFTKGKTHWKCARDFFNNFWTTSSCS